MALIKQIETVVQVPASYHRIEEIRWMKGDTCQVIVKGYSELNTTRPLGSHLWSHVYTFPMTAEVFNNTTFGDLYDRIKLPIYETRVVTEAREVFDPEKGPTYCEPITEEVDINPLTGAVDSD